jgi:hypothetical protein
MAKTQPTALEIEDVERPVHWRDRALGPGYVWLGVIGVALMIFSATMGERTTWQLAMLSFFALCSLMLMVAGLVKMLTPQAPYLMLSPEGLVLRFQADMTFIVPWREMTFVEMTDFEAEVSGSEHEILRSMRYRMCRDVTAVTVPKAFYDAHIHREGLFARGPGWENVFSPAGESVRIILHPEVMDADPKAVFRAVDLRWRAFGAG